MKDVVKIRFVWWFFLWLLLLLLLLFVSICNCRPLYYMTTDGHRVFITAQFRMTTSKSNKASNSHSHYHAVWQNANLNFYHRHCQSAKYTHTHTQRYAKQNHTHKLYTQKKQQQQQHSNIPIPIFTPTEYKNVLFRNKTTVWHTVKQWAHIENEYTAAAYTRTHTHTVVSEWQQTSNDKKTNGQNVVWIHNDRTRMNEK